MLKWQRDEEEGNVHILWIGKIRVSKRKKTTELLLGTALSDNLQQFYNSEAVTQRIR